MTGPRQIGVLCLLVIASTILSPDYSTAQTSPGSPPAAFSLQSSDGQNALEIHALAQVDGRFSPGDETGSSTDTFVVRRLRPILQGRLLQHFEFLITPDFGAGNVVLQDAYFDTVFSRSVRVRVGKFKTPFGFERLLFANSIVFVERALPTELAPNRDVGVQVLGDVAGNAISYQASLTNGVPDFASADFDTNDNKEVTARVMARPFAAGLSRLGNLGVGMAWSQAAVPDLPTLRTASLMVPFLTYTGASADGERVRISPQGYYYRGPLFAFGEWVRSSQPIRRGTISHDVDHTAWQIAAAFVLTGETVTDRAVRPRTDFDFGGGHVGAFQIAARYHVLTVDEEAITLGLAAPGSSRKAESFTVGLNWYLNPFIRYVFNVERTAFDDGDVGTRPVEHAVVFRAQVSF